MPSLSSDFWRKQHVLSNNNVLYVKTRADSKSTMDVYQHMVGFYIYKVFFISIHEEGGILFTKS